MHVALAHLALAPAPHAHPHGILHVFRSLGLVGLFLTSVVDSSFVPLPIPGVTDIMLIVYAAAKSNPVLLVAIATAGSAIGGFLSHAAGRAGGLKLLEKHVPARILARVTSWMEQHSVLAVSLPALLPPPMPLSPFVLVAGAVHMSRKKFMWSFVLSRLLRHSIAVWLGMHYGRSVIHLWQRLSARWGTTILIVVWTLILAFTAIAIWQLYKTSRKMKLQPLSTSN
jgi:membrane protein DedA with SNARE-associated domain